MQKKSKYLNTSITTKNIFLFLTDPNRDRQNGRQTCRTQGTHSLKNSLKLWQMGGRTLVQNETAPDELMPAFNKRINAVQYYFKKIKENNEKVANLKERYTSATLMEQEKRIFF